VPEHEPQPFETCDVCGRNILRGERVVEYVTPDREPRVACSLCRTAAEEAGWVRADSAAAYRPEPPRRRKGLRGLKLRERAERLAARAQPPAPEPDEAVAEPAPELAEPPAAPPPPPPPETPERRMRRGIERFNDSETPRIVAGLTKSLGPPQAAVRELQGPPRVQVTVAWDLSWYRWEIGLNGEDQPREVAKGAEVDELAGDGVDWNATVDSDGRVQWRESS
jgi:hypothetical protein